MNSCIYCKMLKLHLTFSFTINIIRNKGIGADDIFLTIDTFDHTKVEYIESSDSNPKSHLRSYEEPDAIRERMITSYKIAGSMMLVSSLTTAICFFSNSFVRHILFSFEAKSIDCRKIKIIIVAIPYFSGSLDSN